MGVITRGLAVIQYALIGVDGVPGTAWRNLGHTDRDSAVTQVEADPTKDALYAHETDTPLDIEYTPGDKPILFSLINPTIEQRATLLNGSVTGSGAAAVLVPPKVRVPFKCAIRVLPKKGDVYQANHVLLWGKKNADWAKANKVVYDVVSDVLLPTNPAVDAEREGPQVQTIRGGVATATVLEGGTGYTTGTVNNVPLVDLSGEGALATIVIASGAVTTVTITSGGKNYHTGTVLTAPSLAGGQGFECIVATVA